MVRDPAPSAATLTGPALHDAKRELRARIIAARDALDPAAFREASDAIARRVIALPAFQDARCVLLTLPFRSEWDTRPVVRAALDRGKTVALPRVDPATRMLELHILRDIANDVVPGYRGIPEPREDLPRVAGSEIDWVLVPGVAFDANGRRLGYGGGYYDRLLAMLADSTPRVAGAFEVQLVPQVPAAAHDLVVDAVATEARVVSFDRGTT